ncbi:nickel/cobalt transporter [Desulfocurvibacter africanus]|uniref:nickel/cobalt transporter n=1 Tax=Desulfocurvibacter africanus TaxID=873 RepID=UPI0004193D26|nr:high-affinity nickel-transporter [Desulfocurvibacter africanus]
MPLLRITARHPRFLVCALLVMALAWSAAPAAASPFFGSGGGKAAGAEALGAAATNSSQVVEPAAPAATGNPFTAPSAPGASAPAETAVPAGAGGASPFTAAPATAPAEVQASVEPEQPWLPVLLWRKLLVQSTRLQKELRSGMASFARDIRENPTGQAFWLFLLAGFGYGVLHALGPGHGKSFICGYFLSRRGSLIQGLAMGTGSMLAHVASAALMVIALNLFLQRTGMADFDQNGALMQRGSYGLLMAMGALLTLKTLYDIATGRLAAHGHCHASAKGMTAMSLAAGLIPCPGSAVILIFATSLGIFWAGLASLFFVALGMGLTTSAFAMATILFRRAVERGVHGSGRLTMAVFAGLSLTGSLAIALLGAAMFFA